MHMKSSTGLDPEDFGELHSNILKKGIHSILDMKPSKPKRPSLDKSSGQTFLPHLSPGTNPILQFALSPVRITFSNNTCVGYVDYLTQISPSNPPWAIYFQTISSHSSH